MTTTQQPKADGSTVMETGEDIGAMGDRSSGKRLRRGAAENHGEGRSPGRVLDDAFGLFQRFLKQGA